MTIETLMFYILVFTGVAYAVSAALFKIYTFTVYKNDIIETQRTCLCYYHSLA